MEANGASKKAAKRKRDIRNMDKFLRQKKEELRHLGAKIPTSAYLPLLVMAQVYLFCPTGPKTKPFCDHLMVIQYP